MRAFPFPRMLSVALALGVAGALLLATRPGPVQADALIAAEPPLNETVTHAPESVVITFDAPLALEPGANSAALLDAANQRLDDGRAAIAGYSDRVMVVHFADGAEPEGTVRVVWRVHFRGAADASSGSYEFRVDPAFVPEPVAAEEGGISKSRQGLVLWTVAILIGIAAAALLLYYLRVATGNGRSSVDAPAGDHH